MWDIGSSSYNIRPDSSLGHKINILLVDPEKGQHTSTTSLLQSYSYKGTKVETAVAALSLLSKGKKEFDLVLIDINVQDMDAFTLVKLSANMNMLTILMSENDDDVIISKALKNGAFLLVKKPFSIDVVKQLRQHVVRERMHRVNKYDAEEKAIFYEEIYGASDKRKEMKRKLGITIKERGEKRMAKSDVVKKGKKGRKSNKNQEGNSISENNKVRNGRVKKKTSMDWTKELHEKFMDAVNQLGEGRCYPKEILETMNVPGLTRMQVASYLQRCRNDNWQTPVMHKHSHPESFHGSNEGSRGRENPRRFGSMPHIDQIQTNKQEINFTPEIITPSLGRDFTENGATQNQQNGRVRMKTGRGPPTMANTDREIEANYIVNENIYIPTMEKTAENQSYINPINLDVGAVISGGEYQSITMDQQPPPNDELFDYLHESMNDYVPDLTAMMQEGLTVNHVPASQPVVYDYSLPNQATVTSQDIGGEWNGTAANFFG